MSEGLGHQSLTHFFDSFGLLSLLQTLKSSVWMMSAYVQVTMIDKQVSLRDGGSTGKVAFSPG